MPAKGFSLMEMLMAVLVSVILVLGMTQAVIYFQSFQGTFRLLSETQENIRFITFSLRNSIQRAGFIGCGQLSKDYIIKNSGVAPEKEIRFDNALQIFEGVQGTWIPQIPRLYGLTPEPGTDVILVRSRDEKNAELSKTVRNTNHIPVHGDALFNPEDDIIISDCHHAELLQVKSVISKTPVEQELITTKKIQDSFNEGSEVALLHARFYFTQSSGKQGIKGQPILVLYEMDANGAKSEVARGLYQFKVVAYVKNSQNIPAILFPSQVTAEDSIKAMRVDLSFEKTFSFYIPLLEKEDFNGE